MLDRRPPIRWIDRFQEALAQLCTQRPPLTLCKEWNDRENDLLQGWVIDHLRIPWAQGCVTIDAAQLIASHPEEGMDYEERPGGHDD